MRLITSTAAAVIVAMLTGCSGDPFDGFFASGQRYLASKKYADAAIEFQNAARLNPGSAAAQLKLGESYEALNQTAAAAAAYQRACELDPQSPLSVDACVRASARHLALGEFETAVSEARKALSVDQYSLDAQLLLGSALAGNRRFAEAEDRLQAALAQAPTDPRTYQALGDLEKRRGDFKGAERWLRRAAERSPSRAEPRVELAQLYLETGRATDAERELKAAVAAEPEHLAANELLATYLVETDRCDDAEPYWKEVAARSPDGSGVLALADYYVSRGRPDDALKVLDQAGARSKDASISARKASILYDRGDRAKAASIVDGALEGDQSNVPALLLKARMSLDANDLAQARDLVHRAATIAPDAPAVRNMLAATGSASPK